ncbi:MAG: carboxypeptidase-like regulatory domain-containing protein [Cyclobacteriaceae bacterium]
MKRYLLLLFSAWSFILSGQNLITGKVVDMESGEGLIGAHVYLLRDWRKGTTTGMNGNFELATAFSSLDSLVVSFIGFQEALVPVSSAGFIRLKAFEMEGAEVVITAKPLIAEEFKYLKINKLDIYTNPAAKADPVLAVNSLPAATTTDESANISLRGSSPIETGIFLNNVPVYDAVRYSQLNGIGTFSIFNTAIVKDVVVFPGNPPLEFGNTTSGIISLTTDDLVVDESINSAVISLASIGFTREQKLTDNQSLKLFSNWQPSGAIKALNEASLEQIKSFESGDLGIYWYGSNQRFTWKVMNYSVIEGYAFNFRHPSFEGVFDQKKRRSFLVTSVEKSLGNGSLSLNNGLSSSHSEFAYSNVDFEVDKEDLFGGVNYLLSNSTFSLKTGVSYDVRSSKVNGSFHEFFYALGPEHPTNSLDEGAVVKTLEGFAYFKYYPSDQWVIGSGLRKNIPLDGDSYLSRQINIAWSALPWSVLVGAGTYHKNGLLENSGEPFVSRSEQISADIKYEEQHYQLALSLFNKKSKVDSGGYDVRGMELLFDYQLSSKVQFSTSLTWLDASSGDIEIYEFDLDYFIRGNLTWQPGRFWTFESTLLTRDGTLYYPISSAEFENPLMVYRPDFSDVTSRLPSYFNLSISVSKMLPISEKMNVIIFASMGNVLNTSNIRSYDYNFDYSVASPSLFSQRTGYMGVVISF